MEIKNLHMNLIDTTKWKLLLLLTTGIFLSSEAQQTNDTVVKEAYNIIVKSPGQSFNFGTPIITIKGHAYAFYLNYTMVKNSGNCQTPGLGWRLTDQTLQVTNITTAGSSAIKLGETYTAGTDTVWDADLKSTAIGSFNAGWVSPGDNTYTISFISDAQYQCNDFKPGIRHVYNEYSSIRLIVVDQTNALKPKPKVVPAAPKKQAEVKPTEVKPKPAEASKPAQQPTKPALSKKPSIAH